MKLQALPLLCAVLWAAQVLPARAIDHADPPLAIAVDKVPPRPQAPATAGASGLTTWAAPALFSVGIKTPGTPRGVWQATRLVSRAEVLQRVSELRAMAGIKVMYVDEVLPFAVVEVANGTALNELSARPFIDYVEASRGTLKPQDVGCNEALPDWSPARNGDGDVIPRIFALNGITAAWRKFAFGQGVTVGVIDTGLSRDQQELAPGQFELPAGSGRKVAYQGCTSQSCLDTLPDSAFDRCNHGTRIAGAIAAPRNGKSIVGVAYKSSLQVAKAGNGVWCDDWSCAVEHLLAIRHVRNAGSRIIQMAFGGTTYSAPLADGISFEFHRTDMPEVLFVGAAGTTACPFYEPVAFPARMPEVLAVTGVNPDGTLAPDSCTGAQVRLAVTLLDYEVTGMTTGKVITLGATSGASAIVSGSAALIWSRQPRLSRAEVIRRLTTRAKPSQINVPVLQASKAVGGVSSAHVMGWQ